jgi:hypothetical protein
MVLERVLQVAFGVIQVQRQRLKQIGARGSNDQVWWQLLEVLNQFFQVFVDNLFERAVAGFYLKQSAGIPNPKLLDEISSWVSLFEYFIENDRRVQKKINQKQHPNDARAVKHPNNRFGFIGGIKKYKISRENEIIQRKRKNPNDELLDFQQLLFGVNRPMLPKVKHRTPDEQVIIEQRINRKNEAEQFDFNSAKVNSAQHNTKEKCEV